MKFSRSWAMPTADTFDCPPIAEFVRRKSMAKTRKPMPKSWIVTMKCVVRKEVICDDCTEDDARNNPWDFAGNEMETDQEDWEVLSVKPNE